MKRTVFLTTLIMAALLPLAVFAAQVGTFTAVSGGVDIGGSAKETRLVKVGDPVDEGDVIRTKSNSKAEITFDDDNILRMAEKSRIVISEYVSSQESLTAKLTLSRGKVQNIVRRTSRVFGLIKKNRFEVHTPTAVVGVRGTNFFTYYQKGVSGAAFLEGEGYGYNPKMPDQIELVTAGQALLVSSTDAAPQIKSASDPDMDRHQQDTSPPGDEGGDTGDGGDDGQGGDTNAELIELADVVVDPRPEVKKIVEQVLSQPVVTDTLPVEAKRYTDTTVPFTAILTIRPNAINNSSIADFTISATGSTAVVYAYKIDDFTGSLPWFTTTDPSLQIGGLSEGQHQIQFAAVDASGNKTAVSTYRWQTDYTPPEITLVNTPPVLTNASIGTIGANSSEPVTYTYRLDSTQINSPSLSGLSEGPHTFEAIATDAAGNTATASYSWTTDYTAPLVILANTPAARTNVNGSDIGVSSNETVTYTYSLDGNTISTTNLVNLGEGLHSLTVIATDTAGNSGTATHTWTTDYTPPDVLIAAHSIASPGVAGADVDVTLAATATDVAGYTWSLDSGAQTGTGATVNLAGLLDGPHTLTFTSTDDVGNQSLAGTLTFDLYNQGYAGTVSGTGSVLTGTSDGVFSAVRGENWGDWQTVATGSYSGGPHSANWQAETGGELLDSSSAPIGYWLEKIDGASATSSLTALTETSYLAGTGTVAATFTPTTTDAGDWELTSSGSGNLTETPLAFSGLFESPLMFANDGEGVWLDEGGYLQGLLGGLQNPLQAGVPGRITMMGSISDGMYTPFDPQGAYLIGPSDLGMGGVIGTGTTEGAFNGFFIGNWRNGEIDGRLVSIYINQNQDSGLLTDSRSASLQVDANGEVTVDPAAAGIPGVYYPEIGMWEVEGDTVAGPILGATELTADTLAYDSLSALTSEYFSGWYGSGEFTSGATLTVDDVVGSSLRLADQDWGIWNLGLAGYYDASDFGVSNSWQVAVGGDYEYELGFWLGKIAGDSWGTSDIHGTYSGLAATTDASYRFIGEIIGTQQEYFNGIGEWQAAGIGTYEMVAHTFSSYLFAGKLFSQAPGTSYSGEFERWDPAGGPDQNGGYDAHYGYEYFIGEDQYGTPYLRFGTYNASDYMGAREDKLFTPDGIIYDTSDYFARYFGAWTPGYSGLTAADFNDPLARSWTTTPAGSTWEQRWDDAWASNLTLETGGFSGVFYGGDDLWSATSLSPAAFIVLGSYYNYSSSYYSPLIFNTTLTSSPAGSGGTFTGDFSGVLDDRAGKLNGAFYGIYIAPDQSAGILTGQIDYNSNDNFLVPDPGMYMTAGTILPAQMTADTGLTPSAIWAVTDEGVAGSWLGGSFGSPDSWFGSALGMGKTTSLRDHNDWGVFNIQFGWDNHLANPGAATSATARLSGVADFGIHAGGAPDSGLFMTDPLTVALDTPASGLLQADTTGEYLTFTQMGELGGQFIGSYDGLDSWQGVAAGFWQNGQTLAFNGDVDGGLYRTVENVYGYYDNSSSNFPNQPTVFYRYGYETGVERGWSEETTITTVTTTINKHYNPDGTVYIWTDVDGVRTPSSATFTPGTLATLVTSWTPPLGDILPPAMTTVELQERGHFSAIMGSTDDLWSANSATPAVTHLIGDISDDSFDSGEPVLISALVNSINPYHQNNTIWDQSDPANPVDGNGAYMGLLSGLSRPDSSIDLTMQGIYVDPAGSVGFVTGNINGTVDKLSKMWSGDGSLYPIELISGTSFIPSQLYRMGDGGIVNETRERSFFDGATSGGWFVDAGPPEALGSYITWKDYNYTRLTVGDPVSTPAWALGVLSAQYGGGYYDPTILMSDHWRSFYEIMDMNGDRMMAGGLSTPNPTGWDGSEIGTVDTEGQWSNGEISGKGAGAWVSIDVAMTGVAGAELQGTFNPANFTWQMAASWASIDTNTFLGMTATEAGRAALAQLNIPCIEVGRTTLSGVGGVFSDVHINDATFFAYSTGAAPTLWSSGTVGGTYVATPNYGEYVPLTGADGLNADFIVNNWGATTWDARVMGNGTYTGTGSMNGTTVNFDGYAAGTQSGGTAGSFTGTAAGLVAPTVGGIPLSFGGSQGTLTVQ